MTDMTVAMSNGSDQGELIAELARLRAENDKLKAKAAARAQARIHCKVSEKGALSIYGLGRFPITLYLSQYEALDKAWDSVVRDFVIENLDKFSRKED